MGKNTEIMTNNSETLCVFNDPSIGSQFVSFSPDTMEGKVQLYNAINSPDKRLADIINTPIMLRDVIVSKVTLTDRNDKNNDEENPFVSSERVGFRTIIVDADGVSYAATSNGVYNSVATLRAVFGTLHFDEPLKVVVKQVAVKNGNTLTLAIAK